MVFPGVEEYNKYKSISKTKAILHAFTPSLYYIGCVVVGFILFEIIPRIGGRVLENIFR